MLILPRWPWGTHAPPAPTTEPLGEVRVSRPPAGGGQAPWRKALRKGALALLGAEAAYVVLANVALSGGLVSGAVTQDDLKLGLRYEGAWSVVPGLVSFRHASFQSHDSNVQWLVEVSNGRVFVRLWSLANKQISLGHIRGEGVVFRFRHRVETEHARTPKVAAYPPIYGLDDPAVFSHKAGPPGDPKTYWNVALDDVDAGVKEIWIQEYRYEGPGHVRGAFQLAPSQRVWVGPAELALFGGSLTAAGYPVARGLEGLVRADIPEFEVKVPKGLEVLRQISGRVDLDMQIEGLSALELYGLPDDVEVRDGSGQLSTRVRFEQGIVSPESYVHYDTRYLSVRRGAASVVAAAMNAHWEAGEDASSLALDLPFASLWAGRGGGPAAWTQGGFVALGLPKPDLGTKDSWLPRQAHVKVATAGVDDLSRLRALTDDPDGWPLRRGRVRASGELRTHEGGDATADLRAKAEGVELAVGDDLWSGSLSLTTALGRFAPRAVTELPGLVRLEGRDVTFTSARGDRREGFWFDLDTKGIQLAFAPAFDARASWALRARDLSPVTAPLVAKGGVPAWFIKWLEPEGVQASGGFAYAPGRFALDVNAARAGGLDAQGRYVTTPGGSRAAFRVALGPLATGLRVRPEKVDVLWPIEGTWLAGELRALVAPPGRASN